MSEIIPEASDPRLLIIEPYYGGSHRKLIDTICRYIPRHLYRLITMSAQKWHWRARTSALYISKQIPNDHAFEILFCTSVLPLTEVLGLRPDLAKLHKVVYFHENQLEFPVQEKKNRDYQYGFNEILSCLSADKIFFNSFYNQNSFLNQINDHMKIQPDYRIKNLDQAIRTKCEVLYFPLDLEKIRDYVQSCVKEISDDLHIVWPHRWEFDKNPEPFYKVLCRLEDNGYHFKVSILGESFHQKPEVFARMTERFQSKIAHNGYVESESEYYGIIANADVVVSTALHEFFGVAVAEAIYAGCIPILPRRLAYKELYEGHVDELYDTDEEFYQIMERLCIEKKHRILYKDYTHLASPFESKMWFDKFIKNLGCEFPF